MGNMKVSKDNVKFSKYQALNFKFGKKDNNYRNKVRDFMDLFYDDDKNKTTDAYEDYESSTSNNPDETGWVGMPYVNLTNYVESHGLCEYSPYLIPILNLNKENTTLYFPLSTDLRCYSSIYSDKDSLKKNRISSLAYYIDSIYSLDCLCFYDGMSSYDTENLFTSIEGLTESEDKNKKIKSSNYFLDSSIIRIIGTTTLISSKIPRIEGKSKYCLSFYIKNVNNNTGTYDREITINWKVLSDNSGESETLEESSSLDTSKLIDNCIYTDSFGQNKKKIKFSNLWERVSCYFETSWSENTIESIQFSIKVQQGMDLCGFILEKIPNDSSRKEGSLYSKTFPYYITKTDSDGNQIKKAKHHNLSVCFSTGLTGSAGVQDLTNKEWTIIYTKVAGLSESIERIGNVLITEHTEGLTEEPTEKPTRYLEVHRITTDVEGNETVGESETNTLGSNIITSVNIVNGGKRTYCISYLRTEKKLNIKIFQNLILVFEGEYSNISSDLFKVEKFSTEDPENEGTYVYQHILLGGINRDIVSPAARYSDLIYIGGSIITSELLKCVQNDLMSLASVPENYSYTYVENVSYDTETKERTLTMNKTTCTESNTAVIVAPMFIEEL